MSDDNIPEFEEVPVDETPAAEPKAQEDEPEKGFGVGGNIASITNPFESGDDIDVEKSNSTEDPDKGFGTSGDVKGLKN